MESVLRKLDPRAKILIVAIFSVLVFLTDNLAAAVVLMCVFLAVSVAAKMPLRKIRTNFRLLVGLLVFITLLQLLFAPGERYILKPLIPQAVPFLGGSGALKWDGLVIALVTGCRLAAFMVLLPLFSMTTALPQLALGLTKLGLNYRTAYIVTTVFNLIPSFERDMREIIDAQKLRGMRAFEEGSFRQKLRAWPALLIPLVLGAMRRGRLLGIAMDSRAFGAYPSRTWLEEIRMRAADWFAIGLCLVFFILILALNYALKQAGCA